MNAAVAESEQRWQNREQELQSQMSELQSQLTEVSPPYQLNHKENSSMHPCSYATYVSFYHSHKEDAASSVGFSVSVSPVLIKDTFG